MSDKQMKSAKDGCCRLISLVIIKFVPDKVFKQGSSMAYFPRLKELRQKTGLSQNALSRRSKVGRDTISKAENGGDCRPEKLHPLLDALNEAYYDERNMSLSSDDEIIDL